MFSMSDSMRVALSRINLPMVGLLFQTGLHHQFSEGVDGAHGSAKIVRQNCDELLVVFRLGALGLEGGFGYEEPPAGVKVLGDEFGEQPKHTDGPGSFHPGWTRVDRAQRPEERSVRENNRHRYIALESVHCRSRVVSPRLVFRDMVDCDGLPALADFMADRGFNPKLASKFQPEVDFIEHAIGDPAILGHTRHSGKPHTRSATYDIEGRGKGLYSGRRCRYRPGSHASDQ